MDLLEKDFAHFGYPHTLVTDNATSFLSEEFQTWCRQRGITHLSGAPYHAATNGAAERLVQTFKRSLQKSALPPKQALQEFLMQYRRTPLDSGYSPSELLNGRQIRTKLDAIIPSPAHDAQRKQEQEAARQAASGPQTEAHKFKVGDKCYAEHYGPTSGKAPRWIPAVVTKVHGTRSVTVRIVPQGPTWRRHVEQVRPRYARVQGVEPEAPGLEPEAPEPGDEDPPGVAPRSRRARKPPERLGVRDESLI